MLQLLVQWLVGTEHLLLTSAGKESPNMQFIHSARCCRFLSFRWGHPLRGTAPHCGSEPPPSGWISNVSLVAFTPVLTAVSLWSDHSGRMLISKCERGRWLMSVISMLCRVVWQWSWRGAPGALVLVCEGEQSITWACTSWDWLRMDRLSLTEGSTWVLFYHNACSLKGLFFFSSWKLWTAEDFFFLSG